MTDTKPAAPQPAAGPAAPVLPARLVDLLVKYGMQTQPGAALLTGFLAGHPDLNPDLPYDFEVREATIRPQPTAIT